MPNHREIRSLALRTLIPGFHGTTAPQWALDLLAEGLGGYCLFAYNISDPEQLTELTTTLRQAGDDVIVAVDEEGGDVTRLHSAAGSPYPGNAALGHIDDTALTSAIHQSIGVELANAGITVDFAPAVDVNVEDDNPVIGTRSFGRDPHTVARHAAAAITGLQNAGVAACAKHFPGHGATAVDSHLDLPMVDIPLDRLRQRELVPFASAIEAGAALVMSGHIKVPALTGDSPATLSPAAITTLLRQELSFDGAVVTDAMEMKGASGRSGIAEATVQALIAGCDLICTGGEMQKRGPMTGTIDDITTAIATAVEEGRLPMSRLESAVARGDTLRQWQRERRDGHASQALGLGAARRAIQVEGTIPALDGAVIVQVDTTANIAVGESTWGVTPLLAKQLSGVDIHHVTPDNADAAAIGTAAAGRPIVVVARDIHRNPGTREFVSRLSASHDAVVLVEMGWPAGWRPPRLGGYVASFGASAANAQAASEQLLRG